VLPCGTPERVVVVTRKGRHAEIPPAGLHAIEDSEVHDDAIDTLWPTRFLSVLSHTLPTLDPRTVTLLAPVEGMLCNTSVLAVDSSKLSSSVIVSAGSLCRVSATLNPKSRAMLADRRLRTLESEVQRVAIWVDSVILNPTL
jgi:hypothetical protein